MISAERLAEFARRTEPQSQAGATATPSHAPGGFSDSPEALRAFLEAHGVKVRQIKPGSSGQVVLVLMGCPMNPDHGHDTSTAVTWRPRGVGFACQHASCASYHWSDVLAKIAPEHRVTPAPLASPPALPEVRLPGGPVPIREAAKRLGELFAATNSYFAREHAVMRVRSDSEGRPVLEPVKPATLASHIESVARLTRWSAGELVPATCSEQAAKLILHSDAFGAALPPLRLISSTPVLVERDGKLVQLTGYDRASGILAFGAPLEEPTLPEAVALLSSLLDEFRFVTESDRSRALAALIAPALVFSGMLGGRAPIDLSEANESQSGKGYRNKLAAAMYGAKLAVVSQRKGGVGGMEESFDAALISGANFIALDNLRGKLDSPRIESMLTEDTYFARVPYGPNVEIDPRRVVVMLTSNAADITPDLANRASIVRIRKQPAGYKFRKYAEGDLLDHVRAHSTRYLGAVFTVVRAWFNAGKPRSGATGHDFRPWAGTLDWIVQHLLSGAPLLDGHRAAQERVATPGLNWLRDVANVVERAGLLGLRLRPCELLDPLVDAGITTPGVDAAEDLTDEATRQKAFRSIGQQLGRCFRSGASVTVDGFQVTRQELQDQAGRTRREYCFNRVSRIVPNAPEYAPESNPLFPESPESFSNIAWGGSVLKIDDGCASAVSGGRIEKNANHSGYSGNLGNPPSPFGDHPDDMEEFRL